MHPFYYLFFLLFSCCASSQYIPPPPYNCADLIFLSCGSTDNTQPYEGRNWISDTASGFVSGFASDDINDETLSFPSQPADTDPSVSQVPFYHNARIFLSNFTYSFAVSGGPKFLRLYFYPETYSGRDRKASFFSVEANGYTLLRNFSAFRTVAKEFVVNAGDDGVVKLTFVPNPRSYAFVNAIEVVSMPDDLYYDREYVNFTASFQNQRFDLPNTMALETFFRLNVGGSAVQPPDDSCMLRRWDMDQDFVSKAHLGTISVPRTNVSIEYINEDTNPYMAPEAVYLTSRSMGGHLEDNLHYNLTWSFPVDSGFSYIVRLHFCVIQPEVFAKGQLVFNIYIDNQMAEVGADVMQMAGGHQVPVHRDYVVFVPADDRKPRKDMLLAMHPYVDYMFHPMFYDAILNGIEIFKITGSDRSLAGFNPNPPESTDTPGSDSFLLPCCSRQSQVAIFAGVVGFILLSILCFLIFRRRRNRKSGNPSGTTKSTKRCGLPLPSDLCRNFSLAEIRSATNNFDQVLIIGAGGFGNVYKGSIDGGSTHVAIKRLNPGSRQAAHEFLTEIKMLSRLRHLHLVSLIGFSEDDDEMILVYNYMSRGTLRAHLYNTQNPPLTWDQRLQICIGAAKGLQYLHTGAQHPIIHRDVKTTNILLDDNYAAKVSDFGLSRVGSTSVSKTHVTTVVKGSFGYLDPEYFKRQQLTEKSDVYSFGVVLCEVICAKPPLNRTVGERLVSLAEWARDCYRRGTFESLVDGRLTGKITAESLKKYSEIAMSCLADNGSQRPSMNDVVWGLEFVLKLQKGADKVVMGEEELESDDFWDDSTTEATEVTMVAESSSSSRSDSIILKVRKNTLSL